MTQWSYIYNMDKNKHICIYKYYISLWRLVYRKKKTRKHIFITNTSNLICKTGFLDKNLIKNKLSVVQMCSFVFLYIYMSPWFSLICRAKLRLIYIEKQTNTCVCTYNFFLLWAVGWIMLPILLEINQIFIAQYTECPFVSTYSTPTSLVVINSYILWICLRFVL